MRLLRKILQQIAVALPLAGFWSLDRLHCAHTRAMAEGEETVVFQLLTGCVMILAPESKHFSGDLNPTSGTEACRSAIRKSLLFGALSMCLVRIVGSDYFRL